MSYTFERSSHGSTNAPRPQDAALLNGHLEWLLQVGFSADMILKWAREKQRIDAGPVPISEERQLGNCHYSTVYYDDEGQTQSPQADEWTEDDSPIPKSDCGPSENPLDSSLSHDGSYDNEGQFSQSQESPTLSPNSVISTLTSNCGGTLSLSKGHISKRKRKRSNLEISLPIAKRTIFTKESLFRGATTNRQKKVRMRKLMLKILAKLEELPCATPFINFETADDYDEVIDYPMCLREIKDRINRCQCDSRELFCAEFGAIIENCHKYHRENSLLRAEASKLRTKFDKLVDMYLPDDSHLQTLDEGLCLEDEFDEDKAQRKPGSSTSSDHEEDVEEDALGEDAIATGRGDKERKELYMTGLHDTA